MKCPACKGKVIEFKTILGVVLSRWCIRCGWREVPDQWEVGGICRVLMG